MCRGRWCMGRQVRGRALAGCHRMLLASGPPGGLQTSIMCCCAFASHTRTTHPPAAAAPARPLHFFPQVFGGHVVRAPTGVMHGKTSPVFHTNQGLLEGLDNPFK